MIYLDNSATTPIAPEVKEAMMPYFESEYGNASSAYSLGSRAKVALETAREQIASYIGSDAREIIFTSSGTEADNLAIKGPAFYHFFRGVPWAEMAIATSPVEHHAVIHPSEFLAKLGVQVRSAAVDSSGHIEIESLAALLHPDTVLVSAMMVNNEVGAINPVGEIAALTRSRTKALVHTDAVQALGKLPIDVRKLDVDLLTLSAHKIHGPKGIGALYSRAGIEWEPMMHGGAQERNRRGGTESVALAVGFGAAVRLLKLNDAKRTAHITELDDYLIGKLSSIPSVTLNSAEPRAKGIVNFTFAPDVLSTLDRDALLIRFDLEGIAVSNGSACTSGSQQPSHVLLAMGKGKEVAEKSVRVSLSQYNTKEDIDKFMSVLASIIPN